MLFLVESLIDTQQQVDHLERVLPREQIETNLRYATLKSLFPKERVERFNVIDNRRARLRADGEDAYREWNFAPSGEWAAYDFTSHREGRSDADVSPAVGKRRLTHTSAAMR